MGLKERSYKYQLKCEVDGSEDPGDLEKKEKSSGCYTPDMLYRSTLDRGGISEQNFKYALH